jgi:hypothetical protein
MNFSEYRAFGFTQITSNSEFRIYKDRYSWWNMCIPVGTGKIISVVWQGENLIVSTDQNWTYLFNNFNNFTVI